MRVEPAKSRTGLTGKHRELRHRHPAGRGGTPDVGPDLLRNHPEIAPARLSEALETARLLTNPANLLLVALDRLRFGDFDPPASILFLPELGNDPEPNKGVVYVLCETF